MRKIFTFFAAALMSVGMHATVIEHVQIGDLYYNLDTEIRTAAVTWEKRIDTTNYHGLKEALIPDSVLYETQKFAVTAVDSNAFGQCDSLTAIQIPEGVTVICKNGFRQSEHIQSVVIPNSVTEIGDNAFFLCHEVTSLTLGTGLKTIGAGAFSGLQNVSEVIIPENVEYIGGSAFMNCRAATRVVIGSGVKHLGERAFQGVNALPAFEVASGNTIVCVEDGVLFNMNKDTLIQFPGGKGGAYIVPDGVIALGDASFTECQNLTAVTLYVPAEAIEAYQAADTWKDFGTIAAIPAQDIESIQTSNVSARKCFVNGQVFVKKKDKTYTITGQIVK